MSKCFLSYEVSINQGITSYDKNPMNMHVMTYWRDLLTSLTTTLSTMRFRIELMSILLLKGSYEKENYSLPVISHENYDIPKDLNEMSTHVRSSLQRHPLNMHLYT